MKTISPSSAPLSPPPKDLTELDQWVLWAYRTRAGGRRTKIPYQANGKPASTTDPATWSSHDDALDAWKKQPQRFDGIGFVFSPEDPFCGIDLDQCLNEAGEIKPWAQSIIQSLSGTYLERSPSGRGIKIWVRAKLPSTGKKVYVNQIGQPVENETLSDGAIEIYDFGRYFTVTGQLLPGACTEIEDHETEVAALYRKIALHGGPAKGKGHLARLSQVEFVPVGQRHDFLMSFGAQLRARGMERDEIRAVLIALNETKFEQPKGIAEIDGIVDWLCARPTGKKQPFRPVKTTTLAGTTLPEPPRFILNARGEARPLLANAIALLRASPEWKGVLANDEFSLRTVALRPAPWGAPQPGSPWTDQDDRLATEWIQHRDVHVPLEITGQAIQTIARERRFHPVRRYLESLHWDGIPRLENWLTVYLGAQSTPYARAVGACWLISAVARIHQPGCKADSCLILEGAQGIGKSRALKLLAGDWFTDEVPEPGTKDASVQLQGVWIVEFAELDALSRADAARTKAFMSRSTDRFRPPYAKRAIDAPRQCIFAGSSNQDAYLKDETGARRFWPVRCGAIDLTSMALDRDQLWAEAVVRFKRGDIWWLDSQELIVTASDEQSERYESDPWQSVVKTWITDRGSVSVCEVLLDCLGRSQALWTHQDKVRVARSLKALGWERYRDYRRDMEWRYRPKAT